MKIVCTTFTPHLARTYGRFPDSCYRIGPLIHFAFLSGIRNQLLRRQVLLLARACQRF